MLFVMVTSLDGNSLLLTGPPHRQGEVAETCARLPAEDGICSKS
jgi:hypothetical protein